MGCDKITITQLITLLMKNASFGIVFYPYSFVWYSLRSTAYDSVLQRSISFSSSIYFSSRAFFSSCAFFHRFLGNSRDSFAQFLVL